MAENSDNSDIVAENSQELATIEPEKRGRGRPKGSRDAAPRRPRAVRIVEEEPREATPEEPPPTRASAARPAANDDPPPPSPRTMFKQASDSMAALQTQRESARRAYWQDAINRTLR